MVLREIWTPPAGRLARMASETPSTAASSASMVKTASPRLASAGVAARMGKKVPDMIIGTLQDDPQADAEIREYCRIAAVLDATTDAAA